MVNVGPLTAEIGSGVCGTQQISTVSRLGFLTAPTLLNGDQPNFARCLAVSCAVYNIYTFWGLLLPKGIFSAVKFTLRPSLAFSYCQRYCTALEQRPSIRQTLWRGKRNGITVLSQRAPPIFGWAAITLGIGPHSIDWLSLSATERLCISGLYRRYRNKTRTWAVTQRGGRPADYR